MIFDHEIPQYIKKDMKEKKFIAICCFESTDLEKSTKNNRVCNNKNTFLGKYSLTPRECVCAEPELSLSPRGSPVFYLEIVEVLKNCRIMGWLSGLAEKFAEREVAFKLSYWEKVLASSGFGEENKYMWFVGLAVVLLTLVYHTHRITIQNYYYLWSHKLQCIYFNSPAGNFFPIFFVSGSQNQQITHDTSFKTKVYNDFEILESVGFIIAGYFMAMFGSQFPKTILVVETFKLIAFESIKKSFATVKNDISIIMKELNDAKIEFVQSENSGLSLGSQVWHFVHALGKVKPEPFAEIYKTTKAVVVY